MRAEAMQRVLVTGGTGFIGRELVPRLLKVGFVVRCLVRPASSQRARDRLPPEVEVVHGDLRDPESLREATMGCVGVIHLASLSSWDAIASPAVFPVIVEGTRNLLEAAEKAGARRFIYVSSVAALGPSGPSGQLREHSREPIPEELWYARAKREAGDAVLEAPGLAACLVFPAEVYGSSDLDGITRPNLERLERQRPRVVPRGGTSIVHVEEVAEGLLAVWMRGENGGRYLLAGENVTLAELGNLVLRHRGLKGSFRAMPNALLRVPAMLERRLGLPLGLPPGLLDYACRYWFVDSSQTQEALGLRFRLAEEVVRETLGDSKGAKG